jgi:hypothetical protein
VSELDPTEVPILAELEREFATLVAQTLGGASAAPSRTAGPPVRPRRHERPARLATGRRILGRAALAGVLAGAVGATALATRSVVGRGPATPAPVTLHAGGGHTLTLRHYRGRLCLDLAYAGDVASRCTRRPAPGGVAPLSAPTAAGRVVAGLAGAGVATVRVESGGHAAQAPTHASVGGPRWFEVTLPPPRRGQAPAALVVPRRASGAPAGPAVADCTVGDVAGCRAVRRRAAGASP